MGKIGELITLTRIGLIGWSWCYIEDKPTAFLLVFALSELFTCLHFLVANVTQTESDKQMKNATNIITSTVAIFSRLKLQHYQEPLSD